MPTPARTPEEDDGDVVEKLWANSLQKIISIDPGKT